MTSRLSLELKLTCFLIDPPCSCCGAVEHHRSSGERRSDQLDPEAQESPRESVGPLPSAHRRHLQPLSGVHRVFFDEGADPSKQLLLFRTRPTGQERRYFEMG